MGDIFTPGGYPFVDADNDGDLDGMIAFCRAVLAELSEDAIVIPGHGPVSGYADLARFTEMLDSVRERVAALIADGATLEQVVAAKPTAAWDADYGDPMRMIDSAYTSLSR
jgi:glyoxylase-like metal-dependent hydrolase (beta-lactamase superfamily II)